MINNIIKNIIGILRWSWYRITIPCFKLPSKVNSILYVCKGNICRSPFAEMFSKHNIGISNQYIFSSAGIYVESPQFPPGEAVLSGKYFGIDLQNHKSKRINYGMMESSDLIVVMEVWQYKYLRKLFAEFNEKIFLLSLFGDNKKTVNKYSIYNIKDPYGSDKDDYRKCFDRIKCCIEGMIKKIHGANLN